MCVFCIRSFFVIKGSDFNVAEVWLCQVSSAVSSIQRVEHDSAASLYFQEAEIKYTNRSSRSIYKCKDSWLRFMMRSTITSP